MGRKYQGPTLYWRILVDGKYTWKKATVDRTFATIAGQQYVVIMEDSP